MAAGAELLARGVHDARSTHHLVVICLRNDSLGHKEFCKPLIGIAGRRCLTNLRGFLWSKNALRLEKADERGGKPANLLLAAARPQVRTRPGILREVRLDTPCPTCFPEHYEYPPVTHNWCVGQVINHERASNAPYLIPVGGRCQEFVWK